MSENKGMTHYVVDIVLKDGTPKMASVDARNLKEATELVVDWIATLSKCGDKEAEEFFQSIVDYKITASDQKVTV
jgi:hypothetical protein